MLLPMPRETPVSGDDLLLGYRWAEGDFPSLDSQNRAEGQSHSPWATTWPQSSKGLMGPLFRGVGVAEEPPPNCLAAGNNGAIVGGASAGRLLARPAHHGAGPHPRPAAGSALPQVLPEAEPLTSPRLPGLNSGHQQHPQGPPALPMLMSRAPGPCRQQGHVGQDRVGVRVMRQDVCL